MQANTDKRHLLCKPPSLKNSKPPSLQASKIRPQTSKITPVGVPSMPVRLQIIIKNLVFVEKKTAPMQAQANTNKQHLLFKPPSPQKTILCWLFKNCKKTFRILYFLQQSILEMFETFTTATSHTQFWDQEKKNNGPR